MPNPFNQSEFEDRLADYWNTPSQAEKLASIRKIAEKMHAKGCKCEACGRLGEILNLAESRFGNKNAANRTLGGKELILEGGLNNVLANTKKG